MLDNEIGPRPQSKTLKGKAAKGARSMKRGVYLLPNLITTASLFAGFYSIIASLDGDFKTAAVAIIIAGFFDALDGKLARLTGTSSRFGVEYDSLCDLVAFGVAPGVLVFTWALRPFGRYGWLAAFLYVVCGTLRLARYNVQITTVESKRFRGLPIPMAAGLVATTVLLMFFLGQHGAVKDVTILVLVYVLAFLMVSSVKYHSFRELNLTRRIPFRLLFALILLLVVIAAEPSVMLFVIAFGYASSGPVAAIYGLLRSLPKKVHRSSEHKPPSRA